MTDNDEHDTEQAPTTAADSETTELPPAKAAEIAHAWSLDDTTEPEPRAPRQITLLSLGLIALVLVVAGALVFLTATLFNNHRPKNAESRSQPIATAPVAAPPPPVTVTTTPTPVTVKAGPSATVPAPTPSAVEPTPVELTDTDRQFISKLRNGGIEYPFSNPGYPIGKAHAVCAYEAAHQQVAPGVDKSAQGGKWVEENTIWYGDNAVAFSSLAQATYCPQYLDGEY
jgi:hypothetical protein